MQFILVLLGFGVTGMAAGFVAATVVCLPIILNFLDIRPALPGTDTLAYVWEYAKYNIRSNIVGKAYTRFDVFLLGWVGLTVAIGYYEVALSITALATLISGVVMDGIISRVSNLTSRGRPIALTLTATISYTSVIAIPMFVLVVFLSDPLIRTLYGKDYLATIPFLVGICIYRIVQTQREPLDSAVNGMGKPDSVFHISSVTLAVNFALGVTLVVTVGPTGVIIATVIAELLRCTLLHWTLRRNGTTVPLLPLPSGRNSSALARWRWRLGVVSHALPNVPGYQLGLAGFFGCGVYTVAFLLQDDVARRAVTSLIEPLKQTGESVLSSTRP